MRNTLHESEAGRPTFPQVIAALAGAGVESYFADLARAVDTFYLLADWRDSCGKDDLSRHEDRRRLFSNWNRVCTPM
jgi:hypothetical protein